MKLREIAVGLLVGVLFTAAVHAADDGEIKQFVPTLGEDFFAQKQLNDNKLDPADWKTVWLTDSKSGAKVGWVIKEGNTELIEVSWQGPVVNGKAEGKGILNIKLKSKVDEAVFKERYATMTRLAATLETSIEGNAEMVGGLLEGAATLKILLNRTYLRDGKKSSALLTYDGSFKAGLEEGQGKLVANDKTVLFDGEWKAGREFSGYLLRSKGVVTYEGEIREGIANGSGKATFLNIGTYTGEFKDGKYEGQGTFRVVSLSRQRGMSRPGEAAGGASFQGLFANDMPNGQGVSKDNRGQVLHEGVWKDGKLIKIEVAGTARPTFVESPAPATAPFDAATAAEHQTEWAKHLNKQVEITNTIDMKFRLIPPGEFMMGADEEALSLLQRFDYFPADRLADEYPLHKVRITKPFYLGMHEVTLGQFLIFYHDANYKTECERDGKASLGWSGGGEVKRANFRPWAWGFANQTQSHPVVLISWNDAVAFCEWLSRKEGKTYRLPTEAEWEYACKAGTTTRYYFGNDPEDMVRYGNGPDRSIRGIFNNLTYNDPAGGRTFPFPVLRGSDGYAFSSPVGRFRPNSFGLYDMMGNVYEWCGDWHGERYYAESPTDDPQGPAGGTDRIARGGAWSSFPVKARSAHRGRGAPDYRAHVLGFRVVLVP